MALSQREGTVESVAGVDRGFTQEEGPGRIHCVVSASAVAAPAGQGDRRLLHGYADGLDRKLRYLRAEGFARYGNAMGFRTPLAASTWPRRVPWRETPAEVDARGFAAAQPAGKDPRVGQRRGSFGSW